MIQEALSWSASSRLTALAAKAATLVELLVLLVAFELLLQNTWTIAQAPRINADSGTALAMSISLAEGDTGPLIQTLSPPLQTGTYAALLTTGWTDAISAVPVVLSVVLAATLAGIVFKVTNSAIGAAAPFLVLLFSGVFWEQTGFLTFYPAFAVLGYGGLYFVARYLQAETPGGYVAVGAGLLLALSLYAFTTALLFLPIPALMLACYWSRQRLWRTVHIYVCAGIFALPWFVWHAWVGGEHFYYHPLNWFTEDMLPIVNREFWQYPQESLSDYARTMAAVGFEGILAGPVWFLVPLGLVYTWRNLGPRAVTFVILSAGFFVLSLAVMRPSPFLRYYYPVFPLIILLASLGALTLWESISSSLAIRLVMGFVALTVAMAAFFSHSTPEPLASYKYKYTERLAQSASYSDMTRIAHYIDDERGILGRDSAIQVLVPKNQTNTVLLMTESDYVAYLSWPNEEVVLDVLNREHIGWILLYRDAEKWEHDYNIWLERAYGTAPRHYEEIGVSQNFRKVYEGTIYVLYEVLANQADTP